MNEKIKQDYGDQPDINEVFNRTIMKIIDNTQHALETPTELDEVSKTARERALRESAAHAIWLVEERRSRYEERRSRYEERRSQFEKKGGFWARLFRR